MSKNGGVFAATGLLQESGYMVGKYSKGQSQILYRIV